MRDPKCVFCRIVANEIPSVKIYEDDMSLAFLDIAPLTVGHTLVVPKKHARRVHELTEKDNAKVWEMVRIVVPRLAEATGSPGVTIAVNDGAAAGQEVPHVHVHLVPRKADDGFGPMHNLFKGRRPSVTHKELEGIANRIRAV